MHHILTLQCVNPAAFHLALVKGMLPVSDTDYQQSLTHHPEGFNFLLTSNLVYPASTRPPLSQQCAGGWQAVTRIPAVTVNRAGATLTDGP